jgi:hypothetical protein
MCRFVVPQQSTLLLSKLIKWMAKSIGIAIIIVLVANFRSFLMMHSTTNFIVASINVEYREVNINLKTIPAQIQLFLFSLLRKYNNKIIKNSDKPSVCIYVPHKNICGLIIVSAKTPNANRLPFCFLRSPYKIIPAPKVKIGIRYFIICQSSPVTIL